MSITPEQYKALLANTEKSRAAPLSVKVKAKSIQRDRGMNKVEARYAAHLDQEKLAGRILDYKYESIKLRLADLTFITIDFAVITQEGILEFRDTKSWWKGANKLGITEDAAAKMKVAAEQFPWFIIKCVWEQDGVWVEKKY